MRTFLGLCVVAGTLAFAVNTYARDNRIGYTDDFDNMKGWSSGKSCKLSSKNGLGVFQTSAGSWMKKFKWKGEPFDSIASGGTWAAKNFGTIDLGKYHYLVVKTVEKGPMCRTHFCGRELQTTVSTGIIAQDLAPLGITGKREAKFSFELGNNNTAVKIDYIRLVSELTKEEKKGLLPNPITLKKENITPVPYDRLEALNERAARPYLKRIPEEKCAFVDPATGTRKWRATATEAYENFGEHSGGIWEKDGSFFYVLGRRGAPIMRYYYDRDAFVANPVRRSGASKYSYYWKWLRALYKKPKKKGESGFKTFSIRRKDNASGGESEIARIATWEPWEFIEWRVLANDICVFAMREGHTAWIIYAAEADPKKRVRKIKLPSRLKGFSYNHEKQTVSWNRCYTYERFNMDLKSGKLSHGAAHTFGHGCGGKHFRYGKVSSNANGIIMPGAGNKPGGKIKVAGIYNGTPITDYGSITGDDRWALTNGTCTWDKKPTETMGQHLLINLADGATILRVCTYWTSYTNWNIQTRSGASPDYTKVVYMSDMLGDGDYYVAITRNPDPPRNLAAKRNGKTVELSWEKPLRGLEAKGYNIYRAAQSGRNFVRINKEPVAKNSYRDEQAPAPSFYLVAMEEHSGLEGYFSNEASADYDKAKDIVFHFDAANGRKVLPMREVLGGGPPYYRYLRVTPSIKGEETGSVIVDLNAPKDGEYHLLARVRNHAGQPGKFTVEGGGEIPVGGKEWAWVRATKPVRLRKGTNAITLSSGTEDDGIERIVVASSKDYKPKTLDDRKTAAPAAPTNLKAAEVAANSIKLTWDPSTDIDFDYWSVYVSTQKEFEPGNETVLQSGRKPSAFDWGIRPAKTYHYKVIAHDKRGNASKPAEIAVRTRDLDVETIEVMPKGPEEAEVKGVNYVKGKGEVVFDFETKKESAFYLWLQYSPRSAKGTKLAAALDEKKGNFVIRRPGRMNRGPWWKDDNPEWYFDRVEISAPENAFQLSVGKHTLRLGLSRYGPWVAKLFVTDDASFVPEGHEVRVELHKRYGKGAAK